MKVGLVAVVFGVVAFAGGCGTESSEPDPWRECARLRDQQVEERMKSVTADREQHRAALAASLGDGFIRRCVEDLTAGGLTTR